MSADIIPTVPSLGKTESFGLILVGGLVLFALYRVYTTGSKITGTVGTSLTAAGNAIGSVIDSAKVAADNIQLAGIKTANAIGGASPPAIDDQSAAETARLARLAGDTSVDNIPPVFGPADAGSTGADFPWIGGQSNISTEPQQDSPDASGLSVWGYI